MRFVLLLFMVLCLLCDGKLKRQKALTYVCCNATFCSVTLAVGALPVTNNVSITLQNVTHQKHAALFMRTHFTWPELSTSSALPNAIQFHEIR